MKECTETTCAKITTNYSQDLEDNRTVSLPITASQPTPDIPDMDIVLRKFNINPDNFNSVNLSDYFWWKFNPHNIPSTPPSSPTISQRIHTLVRRARHHHTHPRN